MCTNSCGTTTNSSSSLSSSPSAPSPLMDIEIDMAFLKNPNTTEPMATDNNESDHVDSAVVTKNNKQFNNIFKNSDAKNINSLDDMTTKMKCDDISADTRESLPPSGNLNIVLPVQTFTVESDNSITTTDSSNENGNSTPDTNNKVNGENNILCSRNQIDIDSNGISNISKEDFAIITSDKKKCSGNSEIKHYSSEMVNDKKIWSQCNNEMNLCAEKNVFIKTDVVTADADSITATTTNTISTNAIND